MAAEILHIPNGRVRVWWSEKTRKWTGFRIRGCSPVMSRGTKAELVKALSEWEPTEW